MWLYKIMQIGVIYANICTVLFIFTFLRVCVCERGGETGGEGAREKGERKRDMRIKRDQ